MTLNLFFITDHKPLKHIIYSSVQSKKIQHSITIIHGYNCKIDYIEGMKNISADILSHLPDRQSVSMVTVNLVTLI